MKTITTIAAFLFAAILCIGGDQSVSLIWDRNPEPDVNQYIVYYGNQSRSYHSYTNVLNNTNATVTGLDSGTNWYFALTAVNTSCLESAYSEEVVTRIPEKPVPPSYLTNWWNIPPLRFTITIQPVP